MLYASVLYFICRYFLWVVPIKQELENEKKEGLDILINNRNIIAAQKAKAAGGGKKGKKGKKKK